MHKIENYDASDAGILQSSLSDFIEEFWPIVEPGTEYLHNWHADAISEHLTAVTRGDIKNLVINIPPRCAKSLYVCVFWPTWVWTTKPQMRWLFSSYAQSLSVRDNLKCRRIIESPLYRHLWGDVFQLTSDQNTKMKFENNKTGYRIATSVDGVGTGEGADVACVDDPHSAGDMYSDKKIFSALAWWDETMSTRLNDPKTGAKVIVMQRLGERDLSAHVLKQGGYEHLCLPMEFEPDRKCVTSIGWEDPRKELGERLWPERFNESALNEYKTRLGSNGYAGQYQQRPTPAGGGMFKGEWFSVVKAAPAKSVRVRYWDRASTKETPGKDPDWTVGLRMARDIDGVSYIEDIVRFRGSPLEVEKAIMNTASQDGYACEVGLEQDPGQAGVADVDNLTRKLNGYNVRTYRVTTAKELRATPFSAQCEAGNVKLVEGPWIEAFLTELKTFPLGEHDDQVDAASGAFNTLNENKLNYQGLMT